MPEIAVGDRVYAVSHEEGDIVYVFGSGVYEGDFLPPAITPEAATAEYKNRLPMIAASLKEQGIYVRIELTDEEVLAGATAMLGNPRIKLDNGKTVWGCECWWGPEAPSQARFAGRKIVVVDIDEERAQFNLGEAQMAAEAAGGSHETEK